jgi:hypothetical protein
MGLEELKGFACPDAGDEKGRNEQITKKEKSAAFRGKRCRFDLESDKSIVRTFYPLASLIIIYHILRTVFEWNIMSEVIKTVS